MTMTLDPRATFAPDTGRAHLALIDQPLINHVVIVVDNSVSMRRHEAAVREQIRAIQADLREQATLMKQQIRLTIYQFGTAVEVLVFDTDVAVTPDVADRYHADQGSTALLDGAGIGLDDLATTSTLYGDHAFLVYVITDGQENDSRLYSTNDVRARMRNLPDNWTMAMFVPDVRGRVFATDHMGVPFDNVAVWDVHSRDGFRTASAQVTRATQTFLAGRAVGQRGTRTLFSTGADAVNASTVSTAASTGALTPAPRGSYTLLKVGTERIMTKPFVERSGHVYQNGRVFYQFTKPENIQPQKRLVVVNKATGEAFVDETTEFVGGQMVGSPNIRRMLGLPEVHVKVRPDYNPDWAIFVQSTAPNRNLIPGQEVFLAQG